MATSAQRSLPFGICTELIAPVGHKLKSLDGPDVYAGGRRHFTAEPSTSFPRGGSGGVSPWSAEQRGQVGVEALRG